MKSIKKDILKLFINREVNVIILCGDNEKKEFTDVITEEDSRYFSSDRFELVAIFQLEEIRILFRKLY